jgi:heptosyltransferase II
VQRFVALGLDRAPAVAPEIPYPRLRVDEANRERLLRELGLSSDRPVVAFMPGAEYGPAKQWPPEHYRQLASLLVGAGRQVWILGSAKEAALAESIRGETAAVVNLCGRTQLVDVIDLLSVCQQAVTNDSGLMHVAAAVGTPLVAIYGSSTPDYTPPLSARARILYRGLSCSPCFQRHCPLGHTNCLWHIQPAQVLACLES